MVTTVTMVTMVTARLLWLLWLLWLLYGYYMVTMVTMVTVTKYLCKNGYKGEVEHPSYSVQPRHLYINKQQDYPPKPGEHYQANCYYKLCCSQRVKSGLEKKIFNRDML